MNDKTTLSFYLVMRIFALFFAILTSGALTLTAQTDLPPCDQRLTSLSEPWIRAGSACLERVIDDASAGEFGYTALASAPDGTLYAARPFAGQVMALTDMDGDGLPETPTVAAEGLTLPNALAWYDGVLYISGGANLYALRDGEVTTLVDDLPTGEFWTGGVAVLDKRVYVGIGAACDSCDLLDDDSAHGVILSFALDGTDRQVEARGTRNPAALAVHEGAVYFTDGAADTLFDVPDLDEINRLEVGADYGFPLCPGHVSCDGVMPPAAPLPTGSVPTGLASYSSEALSHLTGRLLVVLNGSRHELELRGYRLVAIDAVTGDLLDVMPTKPDDSAGSQFTVDQLNYRGSGFYPHRPISVTVTAEGWVYLSVGGGRILALRP